MQTLELKKIANEVRKGIVTAVHSAKAGHPGGSLSAADIFTYLYFEEMNIDPKNPTDPDRDRFVLSKGHTAPGYYSAMAQRGYFPVEELLTLRHVDSRLQGHPCMQDLPGIDMSSGSLGQGISAAVGIEISFILSLFHFRGDHADEPDQSKQVICMLMAHENFMNGLHWNIGFFQLGHDAVSAACIHQKIFLAALDGEAGIKASGNSCITGSKQD